MECISIVIGGCIVTKIYFFLNAYTEDGYNMDLQVYDNTQQLLIGKSLVSSTLDIITSRKVKIRDDHDTKNVQKRASPLAFYLK